MILDLLLDILSGSAHVTESSAVVESTNRKALAASRSTSTHSAVLLPFAVNSSRTESAKCALKAHMGCDPSNLSGAPEFTLGPPFSRFPEVSADAVERKVLYWTRKCK